MADNWKHVKESEIEIISLELEAYDDPATINKVRFLTKIGSITWKPIKRETVIGETDGFKVTRVQRRPMNIKELPEILFKLRDALQNGNVLIKTSYNVWKKSENEAFLILRDKDIQQMEIVKEGKTSNGFVAS